MKNDKQVLLMWALVALAAIVFVTLNVSRELRGGGECLWALGGMHHSVDGLGVTKGGTIQSWSTQSPIFYSTHPPLQGWYLAIWYYLLGWHAEVTRMAMIISWFAACFAAGWIAKQYSGSLGGGLVAALLFLSFPATWVWGTSCDLTSLNVALMTIGYMSYVFWEQSPGSRRRYIMMLVLFSLSSLADWPGFVCLPTLAILSAVMKRPASILRGLWIGAGWAIVLFCLVFYYLSLFHHGVSVLMESFLIRSGVSEISTLKMPVFWAVRGLIYLLPLASVLTVVAMIRSIRRSIRERNGYPAAEMGVLGFAFANALTFLTLKEWSSNVSQTVLYWVPIAAIYGAVTIKSWMDEVHRKPFVDKLRAASVVGQFALALLVITGLRAKEDYLASDYEVGAWLRAHLGTGELSLYVDHHGSDLNPVAFRYWTRRDVHPVIVSELNLARDPNIFVPSNVVDRIPNVRSYSTVEEYERQNERTASLGRTFVELYCAMLPDRRKFFAETSPFASWVLLSRPLTTER